MKIVILFLIINLSILLKNSCVQEAQPGKKGVSAPLISSSFLKCLNFYFGQHVNSILTPTDLNLMIYDTL